MSKIRIDNQIESASASGYKVIGKKDGEIPVWVQPTGAHDAYNTGDRVYFPTENDDIYESTIDANVYSPTAYPAGREIVQL